MVMKVVAVVMVMVMVAVVAVPVVVVAVVVVVVVGVVIVVAVAFFVSRRHFRNCQQKSASGCPRLITAACRPI